MHARQFQAQPERRKQAIPEQDAGDAAIAGKRPSPEFLAKVERWEAGDASALDGMTVLQPSYRYPHDSDAEDVKPVKRIAARHARALGRFIRPDGKSDKAWEQLLAKMRELPVERLRYWESIIMIDHRWCGATGTGAYWAVASKACNDAAALALAERKAA